MKGEEIGGREGGITRAREDCRRIRVTRKGRKKAGKRRQRKWLREKETKGEEEQEEEVVDVEAKEREAR